MAKDPLLLDFFKPDVSYVQSSFIFYMSNSLSEAVLDDTDL